MDRRFRGPGGGRRAWLHRSLRALAFVAAGALGPLAAPGAAAALTSRPPPSPATTPTVVVVGDSLSAEYGLRAGEGWVHLLAQRLSARHLAWQVVNASISGDTTAGGRSRLPGLLAMHHPRVVVIELGGNDALRGTPLAATRQNLRDMIDAAHAAGARVLLLGIQVPPNYGRAYTEQFAATYADLARETHVALVPFLLKGIADRPDADAWFQADRIHPVARAHPIILDNVWPALAPLLRR